MRKCAACGGTYRKGTIAFVLTSKGMKGATVCPACAKGGVLIVPAGGRLPARPPEPKVVKLSTRKLTAHLEALAKLANVQGEAENEDFLKGRSDGLWGAIHAIKSGRFAEGG